MKKVYNAPKSNKVLFDPLMSIFGTDVVSTGSPTLTPGGQVSGQDVNPHLLDE